MKKSILALIIIICLAIFIFSYTSYNNIYKNKSNYDITLEIKKGESIWTSLERINIQKTLPIRIFLKFARSNGKNIKAGYYVINGDYSKQEVIDILVGGKTATYRVTIMEGETIKNIIQKLSKLQGVREEEYKTALTKIKFPYPTPKGNFEGYLYPDTYFVPKNLSPEQTLNLFLNKFLKEFPAEKYANDSNFYSKLIMASIVEREAKLINEKPIIASVFYNRLAKKMRLGSDATVNYLYNYTKKKMYYKDLEIDSPYNTYKNRGLPPAPIGNPDKNSIMAAINPTTTDYLFFVADGTGAHHFTKTYKEHLEFQKNNTK